MPQSYPCPRCGATLAPAAARCAGTLPDGSACGWLPASPARRQWRWTVARPPAPVAAPAPKRRWWRFWQD